MSKGRRRREARRRAKQRRQEQQSERPPGDEGAQGELRERPGGDEPVRSEEAAGGRRGRTARKRAKRKGGFWERVSRIRVSSWMIAVPVLVIGTGVLAFLIITSGSSGTTGGSPASTPTPDPRVAGTPVAETFNITAGDDGANPAVSSFFRPDTITAKAGEVIEFVLTNEGSVTHNIWVAGADEEYGTKDDFGPIDLIKPGETGRLLVKIDEPDTYSFRCEIHPNVQFGTLVLQ